MPAAPEPPTSNTCHAKRATRGRRAAAIPSRGANFQKFAMQRPQPGESELYERGHAGRSNGAKI
eukprot:10702339-Karenia_brevis.AAC.1